MLYEATCSFNWSLTWYTIYWLKKMVEVINIGYQFVRNTAIEDEVGTL